MVKEVTSYPIRVSVGSVRQDIRKFTLVGDGPWEWPELESQIPSDDSPYTLEEGDVLATDQDESEGDSEN